MARSKRDKRLPPGRLPGQPRPVPSWTLALMLVVAAILLAPAWALAARVSGILTGYESSTPLKSRDLHFQNNVTGDVYLSPTHQNGAFAVTLPPGIYSLRTETGAVLLPKVRIEGGEVALGTVSELAPYAPRRLWQRERLAPSILISAAPSTAYVMTAQTIPVPAGAVAVPKPEIDWSRPPPGTEASAGPNLATGVSTAPISSAHPPQGMAPMGGQPPLYAAPSIAPGGAVPGRGSAR